MYDYDLCLYYKVWHCIIYCKYSYLKRPVISTFPAKFTARCFDTNQIGRSMVVWALIYGILSVFLLRKIYLCGQVSILVVPQPELAVVVGPEGEHSPAHGAHQRVVTCNKMPFRTWLRIWTSGTGLNTRTFLTILIRNTINILGQI